MDTKLCIKCGKNERRNTQRYCDLCHAAYMRTWRKGRKPSDEQRRRSICRSIANVYQNRGKLEPQPCAVCGAVQPIEKHHKDYGKPLIVMWLCRLCHVRLTHSELGT